MGRILHAGVLPRVGVSQWEVIIKFCHVRPMAIFPRKLFGNLRLHLMLPFLFGWLLWVGSLPLMIFGEEE